MLHESPPLYQSQTPQHYSLVSHLNVKDMQDLDPYFGSQDNSSAQSSGDPSVPIQDDAFVEEVALIKKKASKRRPKSKTLTISPKGAVIEITLSLSSSGLESWS
ncbi:hypothetical protein Tco_1467792 [Tanacetum coccineum]